MKVWLNDEERYPTYYLAAGEHGDGGGVEVEDAIAERWARVAAEFEAAQTEMKAASEAAWAARRRTEVDRPTPPQELMMAAQDQFNRDYAEAHRRPSAYDPFGAVADRFGTVFQRLDDAEGNA